MHFVISLSRRRMHVQVSGYCFKFKVIKASNHAARPNFHPHMHRWNTASRLQSKTLYCMYSTYRIRPKNTQSAFLSQGWKVFYCSPKFHNKIFICFQKMCLFFHFTCERTEFSPRQRFTVGGDKPQHQRLKHACTARIQHLMQIIIMQQHETHTQRKSKKALEKTWAAWCNCLDGAAVFFRELTTWNTNQHCR